MNKYAAFDSSAINYLRATKDDRVFEELKQLGFQFVVQDKVIEEAIINQRENPEVVVDFFVRHSINSFGFLPNSDEDLYKAWNNDRFQNRLKPIDVSFMNKMIESSKTLSIYDGSKKNIRFEDQLRQTELFQHFLKAYTSPANTPKNASRERSPLDKKFKALFKKEEIFSQHGWNIEQTNDILYYLAMKELFNKEKEFYDSLWSKVLEENGEGSDIKYNELLQRAMRRIFPSKIEYPTQGKGLLIFENGESVEILEVEAIKNDPFLHYSLFSTDAEYKVVDPSSGFPNNVEALKDRYPFYWFAILQLILLELLNKVVGKNINANVPKMHCLFKIPVNLIAEWRSTEQMNNLYIKLNKDNKFYDVDIKFKNNPLPDLKIGGILPFVERFYTCDRGQAQILIFLFPEYAHKIEFISKG